MLKFEYVDHINRLMKEEKSFWVRRDMTTSRRRMYEAMMWREAFEELLIAVKNADTCEEALEDFKDQYFNSF